MLCGGSFKAGSRVLLGAAAVAGLGGLGFLGIAGALSLVQGSPYLESDNLFFASICTLIALVFLALVLFGKETIHLPLGESATFLEIARDVLREMGYEVTRQSPDTLATRRRFHCGLFGCGILIQCADRQAHISGPKIWVEALRRRLRVQSFLSATEASRHDGTSKGGGALLKRVQIHMRVPAESLEDVSRHVVKLLEEEATVICEVNILAQSDTGIREATVELHIRPWLGEQGITADIHKELAKMSDPNRTMILPGNRRRRLQASESDRMKR